MPRRRPASYTTFAVLNFIVGGFALLCSVCGGIEPTVEINHRDVTPEFRAYLNQEIPGYTTYKVTGMVVGLLLGAGLITAGVGLLVGPGWGRVLAIVCCALAVLHHAGLAVFQLFLVGPAMTHFFTAQGGGLGGLFSILPRTAILMAVVWELIAVLFYIIQILVLAFQPLRPARAYVEDEDDWEDRPRRRRYRDEDDDYDEPPRRRPRRRDGGDEDDER
jgi:hypothetical protein